MKEITYKCVSDWKQDCICQARQCKRLEKLSDQEILDLL